MCIVYVQVCVCASMCMCKYVWYEVGENEVSWRNIFGDKRCKYIWFELVHPSSSKYVWYELRIKFL